MGWFPATVNVHVPTGRSTGHVWPQLEGGSLWPSAYLASSLSSICRDRCIRRAQFPRPPLITNVGGCGGQSSGHAPPRRLVPDCWLSFSMCQFETHRVESQPQLRDCRSHNSTARQGTTSPRRTLRRHTCIHAHTHTHTHIHIRQYARTWPYQVASSGPRSTRAEIERASDAYGDAASRLNQ